MNKARQRRKKRRDIKMNGRDWREEAIKVEDYTRRNQAKQINT